MQPVSVAILALLESLDPEQSKQAFVRLCITLSAASRRFRVGKGILRLVKYTAEQKQIELPSATRQLFAELEERVVKQDGSSVEDIGLDYLLEKWDDLDLWLDDDDSDNSEEVS